MYATAASLERLRDEIGEADLPLVKIMEERRVGETHAIEEVIEILSNRLVGLVRHTRDQLQTSGRITMAQPDGSAPIYAGSDVKLVPGWPQQRVEHKYGGTYVTVEILLVVVA